MPLDEARVAEYKARLAERERIIRESWVRSVEAQLVREKLDRCYESEGVNHLESCKDLRERYIDMLRDNRVKGYKNIDV
ncbi:NADH-ubiquinone oxidoreductase 12 kDa subunit [Trametes versicolor FP-101664 SS1]|uniref:NADH-ubiquinone oxidoreductase 12 kDa subunit, mitochondrial n=1 Tax=Trametes pubescens TaxID=154538 RepID=A0A1M2VB01_TRAPU|nr:NADH-ubiquinone oxidoreductase 12 kDa subunit [Trametes versicolor FP-101664 SS1]EIW57362.1 NADH-ubiquinone oxidoreductase 12 kDa subunit [Trametes versicolor FP-101664 SS1]OJT04840.1 NADH-ubiquinone oxidoreductase 12 kDa subunit, mitochondrial [Trametes pubescens]